MTTPRLYLFDFFVRVREAFAAFGIRRFGVGEYTLLLEALSLQDNPLSTPPKLRRLCEILWSKSQQESRLLNLLFDELTSDELFVLENELLGKTDNADKAKAAAAEKAKADAEKAATEKTKADAEKSETQQTDNADDNTTDNATIQKRFAKNGGSETMGLVKMNLSLEHPEIFFGAGQEDAGIKILLEDAPRFIFSRTPTYFASERTMQQAWRGVRYRSRSSYSTDIDIPAFVEKIAREVFIPNEVYEPKLQNKLRLLFLVDHRGSMLAFESLADQLIRAANADNATVDTLVKTYFFYNTLGEQLYERADYTRAQPTADIVARLSPQTTQVVIFSDGGAARNAFNAARFQKTTEWLNLWRPRVRRIVWLNPMPINRWRGTTAGYLSENVPMFPIFDMLNGQTTLQLDRTVKFLKGQTSQYKL